MTNGLNFAGSVAQIGGSGETVTLVDETTFSISNSSGDIVPEGALGLFFQDTRVISRCELLINGARTQKLAVDQSEPFHATFISRSKPNTNQADSNLLIFRDRFIGRGMREDIRIQNFGQEAAYCSVELFIEADFANLFAVKEGRVDSQGSKNQGDVSVSVEGSKLAFSYQRGTTKRGIKVSSSQPPKLAEGIVSFEVVIAHGASWSVCIEVVPQVDGTPVALRYPCGQIISKATPTERLAKWRKMVPLVDSDDEGFDSVVARSLEDLGSLRIFDPDFPDRSVIAAGAPWFMTVFGRDSLWTSYMALIADPELARGVLMTLARFQGSEVDPRKDEEPGKILHEMRFGDSASLSLGGGSVYYGSVDATPLFVMMLGELRKWGLATELVDELLPHADRALEWIENYGDRDGDGFVEYLRSTDRGLANQGWKDSFDGIRYASGEIASAPIALCEVQAYTYGAYLARAHFANEAQDLVSAEKYISAAERLKKEFNEKFWLEEQGWYAIGLDANKKPIDSLTSNIGHCLWSGIIDQEKAEIVASKLLSKEMYTGWGIRTLASSMGGYNPVSYHCGSVWPHDNAIIAAGLNRYGFVEQSHKIIAGLLEAAQADGGRLPELFSGLDRDDCSVLVGYPTSCSPQAWASAAPLLALRILLRFEPWIPQGKLWISPALPEGMTRLKVDRIPLAGCQVNIEIDGNDFSVEGLPDSIELVKNPREPHSSLKSVTS